MNVRKNVKRKKKGRSAVCHRSRKTILAVILSYYGNYFRYDNIRTFFSVCSTTLWVGHLSKLVHQEELSDTFGEFGDIVSIDLILPRGCAFIVMHRRQDAARCLTKLKNHKMQGKAITVSRYIVSYVVVL